MEGRGLSYSIGASACAFSRKMVSTGKTSGGLAGRTEHAIVNDGSECGPVAVSPVAWTHGGLYYVQANQQLILTTALRVIGREYDEWD